MRAPILLVDDRPANLLALEAVLAGPEHELVSVPSGFEALAQLEEREFAVVLLDLQMPVMDGVETATRIREVGHAHGQTVPIIFLTATEANVPRVLHAYQSGAVDFIQKPLQPEILRSKVEVFADLYRARQRLVAEIEQRRRLQGALRARDELLAIVSHDLRNPLNAVLLGANQVERAAEQKEWAHAKKAVGSISKAVERMSQLVGNLLDLATLDAGRVLPMEPGKHDLADLAHDTVEILEPLADAKGVKVHVPIAPRTFVLCDADRVQQVLANLVGNAIKFTPSNGAVEIGAAPRGGEVLVSVKDTGMGIRADDVAHIFEAYWKADPNRKNGAGLGLSIARAIVEAHGGRIWVDTQEGRGSTFTFTLCAADAPSEASREGVARLGAA